MSGIIGGKDAKTIGEIQAEIEAAFNLVSQIPVGALPPGLEPLRHLAPRDGERVIISLRRGDVKQSRQVPRNVERGSWAHETGIAAIAFIVDIDESRLAPSSEPMPATPPSGADDAHIHGEFQNLLLALDAAERDPRFREFVGIKPFRDDYLPKKGFWWAGDLSTRHAALAAAIERGWILKGSVANPRSPAYPTTTIRVNRNHPAVQEALNAHAAERSPFRPVTIAGGELSQTVLNERR